MIALGDRAAHVLILIALAPSLGGCVAKGTTFAPVPTSNLVTSEVSDPEGDGVQYWDESKWAYVDGPDIVAAAAILDLKPASGQPSIAFRVRLNPSESAIWQARFTIQIDLDSRPVTPSFREQKGVALAFQLSDRDVSVRRGDAVLGRVPLTVEPGWGSGRVGADLVQVALPVAWLARRTEPPLPRRTWPEWVGHRGRPLAYRVTVSTDARSHQRVDALPDRDLPPAVLPLPVW